MKELTKYLAAILDVLKTQTGQLTDRQIHYRLVAKGFYPNNRSSYNHLTKVLKDERISGAIPWDRIVDSSKPMFLQAQDERDDGTARIKFEHAKENYDDAEINFRRTSFYTSFWTYQPEYIEVWCEKDALARILKEITDDYMVSLIICKGYQSITNEKNRRDYYFNREHHEERKVAIIYFGDFDPRGENIPQVIKRDFQRLGYQATLDKVALTPEQIRQYNLVPAPCKKTDSMASHWIEENGDVAYELDALEPNVLRQIVKDNIEKHISQEAYAKRNEYMKQENDKLAEMINEYLSGDGD
jgi:hypothetical protein